MQGRIPCPIACLGALWLGAACGTTPDPEPAPAPAPDPDAWVQETIRDAHVDWAPDARREALAQPPCAFWF